MKLALANLVREYFTRLLYVALEEKGEDVGMIASNSFNFPAVYDSEECFVEVVVKVVKKEADECYQERADYIAKCEEKKAKAAEREKAAAEKKAKAEAKAAEKAKKEAE